jgi:hypothetical protein
MFPSLREDINCVNVDHLLSLFPQKHGRNKEVGQAFEPKQWRREMGEEQPKPKP